MMCIDNRTYLHPRLIGVRLQLTANYFGSFIQCNLINTMAACEIMQCSRQNRSYFVKRKTIKPVIKYVKEKIYTRGTVEEI